MKQQHHPVGNSDQRLQGRHDTSKIKSVTMYVPIVPGKDSTKKSTQQTNSRKDGFIKSNESSRR